MQPVPKEGEKKETDKDAGRTKSLKEATSAHQSLEEATSAGRAKSLEEATSVRLTSVRFTAEGQNNYEGQKCGRKP